MTGYDNYSTDFMALLSKEVQNSKIRDKIQIDTNEFIIYFHKSRLAEIKPYSVDYGSERPLVIVYGNQTFNIDLEESVGYEKTSMIRMTVTKFVALLECIYGCRGSVSIYTLLGNKTLCIDSGDNEHLSLSTTGSKQSFIPSRLIRLFGRGKRTGLDLPGPSS